MAQNPAASGNQGRGAPDPSGFANSAASAYGDALRFATQMRAAAAQQQAEKIKENLALQDKGYTPYTPDPQGSAAGGTRDSVSLSNPNGDGAPARVDKNGELPPGPDPSLIRQSVYNGLYLAPDKAAEQAKKDAAAGEQEKTALLEKGARPVGADGNVQQMTDVPRYQSDGVTPAATPFGINAPAPAGQTVTPKGSKQGYYVPTEDEKQATGLRAELAKASAMDQGKLWHPPDSVRESIEERAGLKPGSLKGQGVPHEVLEAAFKGKPEAKAKTLPDYVAIVTAPKGTYTPEVVKGANAAIRLLKERGEKEGGDQPKKATPTQLNSIESIKKAQWDKAEAAYQKVIKSETALDGDKQQAEEDRQKAQQKAQDDYEQRLGRFGYPTEHYEVPGRDAPAAKTDATPQQPEQPGILSRIGQVFKGSPAPASPARPAAPSPAPAPGAPTAAPAPAATAATAATTAPTKAAAPAQKPAAAANAAPKTSSLAQVRAYAKKKGVSDAAAIKEFKTAGYAIGQ